MITLPQLHLIMLGLGLLTYILISGFRSSRTSPSRQHRRTWWLAVLGGIAAALSPLSRYWRPQFDNIDLLTQSLLLSIICLLGFWLVSLLRSPFKVVRRFFRKRRHNQDYDYMLDRTDSGLTPISINAESGFVLEKPTGPAAENADPLQTIHSISASDTDTAIDGEELFDIDTENVSNIHSNADRANFDQPNFDRTNTDQANTQKLDASSIESVVPMHGKSDGTQQLDDELSRTSAANDKISVNKLRAVVTQESREDETLQLDDLADQTLRLDELSDDVLQMDEMLSNDELPANSASHADSDQQIDDQHTYADEHADESNEYDAMRAEDVLFAEDSLLVEDELGITSIPSDEEGLDLSETGNLFSEIRSQQTEVELPDDKELRDAAQASAIDELDLDTSLLVGDKSTDGKTRSEASDDEKAEIEEANVVVDEAELEFGNDLTGEYAHPADDFEHTPEQVLAQAAKQAQGTLHEQTQNGEQALSPEQTHDDDLAQDNELETDQEQEAELHTDYAAGQAFDEELAETQVIDPDPGQFHPAAHHAGSQEAEPETLSDAITAAKLTAETVELQVSNLEQSIAKLDGLRDKSVDTARLNAEKHTAALEQSNVIITREDEARSAAESVIEAQKKLLKHAKRQRAQIKALLKRDRKRLELLQEEVGRSRKMAKTAALLARKAAVAQQENKDLAKREQTARLKSEESTRKAVNIARNAINALAEEERKRDLTQH